MTLAAIKQLYYTTTKPTIQRDFDRAIDLLKAMSTEEERERATVYMQGLAEMKAQWCSAPDERRTTNDERRTKNKTLRAKHEEQERRARSETSTRRPKRGP